VSDRPSVPGRARAAWTHRGQRRPPFAREPGPGQESVWDYPRPPAIVPDQREIVVRLGEREIARSLGAVRVLETASPPTFYLPPRDVEPSVLMPAAGSSFCEWKGRACYFDVRTPEGVIAAAAWAYPEPFAEFASIAGWFAFYPGRVGCFVDGERARAQAGGFYGGWITAEIVGPFKGEPGTALW
jgi:uncharacterized protein (DUF427 family)